MCRCFLRVTRMETDSILLVPKLRLGTQAREALLRTTLGALRHVPHPLPHLGARPAPLPDLDGHRLAARLHPPRGVGHHPRFLALPPAAPRFSALRLRHLGEPPAPDRVVAGPGPRSERLQ